MPMTNALLVHFRGPMPQETLDRLRAALGLTRRGRLTDAEDERFGYRYLQHDDDNWVDVDLWREDDEHWLLQLSHLKARPADAVVDEVLAEARTALAELGFVIESVERRPAV